MLQQEDRQRVADRLDHAHISSLADDAKHWLFDREQAVELEYTPGNATWYSLIVGPVLSTVSGRGVSYGSKPDGRSYLASGPGPFFICYCQQGTMTWFARDRQDWEWIAGKLTDNEHDQVAIGLLLKAIFGRNDG